ncbi:probable F-box protein At4g22165 isoform X2 [Phragmites australis]|uniref:probable F-box protein At4g22165 isoform X2 n=1 Tax=Phragmites australis TaxID=29695 RepID=UPI002D794ED3|nr:probable F-box protein At4g22165 isoform X2 [Phragmites australis]
MASPGVLQDLWHLPPEKSKENILLFFILYNLEEEELCFVRSLLIKASGKLPEILTKLSEMAGFTPCEEIELHESRVKFTFASISCKYSQEPTLGVLHLRLQLCKNFCRSNSSSMRPGFAPMGPCSISWIMSLRSLAIHPRNLRAFVFRTLPKLIVLSPGLLNKFREEHVHPPLMEISAGKLPELPREILMDIFALLEIPDLVRVGSVCSSWNSAYTSLCNIGQYKQSQTPCLLYTSESAGENVACLYSLAEKRAYKLTLPELPIHRRYLIGSSHGWMVTVDEWSEMHLVNPITCEQIALPSVITIEQVKPIYDDGGAICKYHYSMHTAQSVFRRPLTLDLGKLRYYFHHKALVFYDTSSGSYIVVFIHNPFGQLLFARLGDVKWTWLPSHRNFQDCIYKDGLLYAVTSFGEIIAFDLSGSVVTTKIIMDRVKNHCGSESVYIVQAPWGDLLQVWRPVIRIKEEHKATFENTAKWMEIYKVCTVTKKLVRIDNLDDHVLFLVSNQSLCSRAEEYPQLKPNHVYFTDDFEGRPFACERGYRLDIGVLNFGNKSMEEIISPRPWSNCQAPLLIILNPRKMDSALHI